MKKSFKIFAVFAVLVLVVSSFNVLAANPTHADAQTYVITGRSGGEPATSSSLVNLNGKIDTNKYGLVLGKYDTQPKYSVQNQVKLTDTEKQTWYPSYEWNLNTDERAYSRVEASDDSNVKGKFSITFTNIGKYNGKDVDLKMTIMDYARSKDRSSNPMYADKTPAIGFYTKYLGVAFLAVDWAEVKYEFFESGTSLKTPLPVKGWTSYWDVDGYQGLHFLDGDSKLYVSDSCKLETVSIGGATYVYDNLNQSLNESNGWMDGRGAVTETFDTGTGNSITRVYTIATKNETGVLDKATGGIMHTAVVDGALKGYASSSAIQSGNSVKDGDVITYEIQYTNGNPEQDYSVEIKDILSKGLKYRPGTSKINGTQISDPTPAGGSFNDQGQELTWNNLNIAKGQTAKLTYEVEVTENTENSKVVNKATVTIGNRVIGPFSLENPLYISVNYTSDEGGLITQEGTENNKYTEKTKSVGENPSGASHEVKTGYCFKGWDFDKAVTINQEPIAPQSILLTDDQVKQVVLKQENDKMTFTAIHEKCAAPEKKSTNPKIPNTASTVSVLAISAGALLICAGGLAILKRKQV